MKILIFMAGFFPGKKYGGPPVSVNNFCSLMSNNECYIATKNHDQGETEAYKDIMEGWNDRGNCKVKYLHETQYNKRGFEEIILEIQPDVIYLQGLFQACILPCLLLAKKHRIKVILAPRGELCKGALSIRRKKKIAYIIAVRLLGLLKNATFQSTSDEESEEIHSLLRIPYDRIHFLPNIPSIPSKQYEERKKKKAGSASFVFLSRIHPKKNLLSAINYMQKVTGDINFDIYGPIEDADYWNQCKTAIESLPDNISVKYCGLLDHGIVHETLSRYDAFLFPTLSENYGHVIAEALFAGTWVIISNQTPWNDVACYNAGDVIDLKNDNGFICAIQSIVDSADYDRESIKAYVARKTNLDKLEEDYCRAFKAE